jgi:MYXO-CTERM domain-containing protein
MNHLRPARLFATGILGLGLAAAQATAQTTDDTARANPRSTIETGKGSPSSTDPGTTGEANAGAPKASNFEVPPRPAASAMASDTPDNHSGYGWGWLGLLGLAGLAGLLRRDDRMHRRDNPDAPRTA